MDLPIDHCHGGTACFRRNVSRTSTCKTDPRTSGMLKVDVNGNVAADDEFHFDGGDGQSHTIHGMVFLTYLLP